MPEHGIQKGEPFARPHPRAWVQIAAVTIEQTQNTMALFQGLFSDECKAEHRIDLGKEKIYAYGGQKKIQAVTSSPRALEGNRPTLIIMNETHHWLKNNEGIAMADAIERNATKSKGGAARTLSITNAYQPSEDSVARQQREAFEEEQAGLSISTGVMYDSLEAPRTASLAPKMPEGLDDQQKEARTRRYLSAIIDAVKGDSWWLDTPSLVNSILKKKFRESRSRRFWFNQVVALEDAWLNPFSVDAAISQMVKEIRSVSPRTSQAILEAGWLASPQEPVVMFLDCSKSDDATALVGCRLRDGYIFTMGIWQKPKGAKNWLAPRGLVDERVKEMFKRFNIVAFWADPGHAKDDEDSTRYWDGFIDTWMLTYKDRLDPRFWPIQSGHRRHAIMFDMSAPDRQKMFISAAEEFVEAMENLNDIEEFAPLVEIDGHPALVQHLKNAIRYPHPLGGISLIKEHRESSKKIDLAVSAVGARMLRRIVMLGAQEEEEKPAGVIWGVDF